MWVGDGVVVGVWLGCEGDAKTCFSVGCACRVGVLVSIMPLHWIVLY